MNRREEEEKRRKRKDKQGKENGGRDEKGRREATEEKTKQESFVTIGRPDRDVRAKCKRKLKVAEDLGRSETQPNQEKLLFQEIS